MDTSPEIVSEVTNFLGLHDLLRLARSFKKLREILIFKFAWMAWVNSRHNVPSIPEDIRPPDRPMDPSEPAYASLVFDTGYLQCGAKLAGMVDLTYRFRACVACFKAYVFPANDARVFRRLLALWGVQAVPNDLAELSKIVPNIPTSSLIHSRNRTKRHTESYPAL